MNLTILCIFSLVVACQTSPLLRFKRAFEESASKNQKTRNKQITPITLKIVQNNASPITLLNSRGSTLSNQNPASETQTRSPPIQEPIDQRTIQEPADPQIITEPTSQLADHESIDQPAEIDESVILKHCLMDGEAGDVEKEEEISLACPSDDSPSMDASSTGTNPVNSGKHVCSCKKSSKGRTPENKISANSTAEEAEAMIKNTEESNNPDFTCSCKPADVSTYDLNPQPDEESVNAESKLDIDTSCNDFQAALVIARENFANISGERVFGDAEDLKSFDSLTCSCSDLNRGANDFNESLNFTCSCKKSELNPGQIHSSNPCSKNMCGLSSEQLSHQTIPQSNTLCSCPRSNSIDEATNASPPITCVDPVSFGGKTSGVSESTVNSNVRICDSDATEKVASDRTFCRDCDGFNCDCGACSGRGSNRNQQSSTPADLTLRDSCTQESPISDKNKCDNQPYILIRPMQREKCCDAVNTQGELNINEDSCCRKQSKVKDSTSNNCCTSGTPEISNDNCSKQKTVTFCPLQLEKGCCDQSIVREESKINNNGCSRRLSISVVPLIQQTTNYDQEPNRGESRINNDHCDQQRSISSNPPMRQEGCCCQKSTQSYGAKIDSNVCCDQPTHPTEACSQQLFPIPVEQKICCNQESPTNFNEDLIQKGIELFGNLSCSAQEAQTQVINNNTDLSLKQPVLPRMCAFIMYPRMNASNFDQMASSNQLSLNPMLFYPFDFNKVDQIVCSSR